MSKKINVGGASSTYGKEKSCITGSGERGGPNRKRQLDVDGRVMD
jgi:hypothetical protein